MSVPVPEEMRQHVRDLYAQGIPKLQIHHQTHVSRPIIDKILKEGQPDTTVNKATVKRGMIAFTPTYDHIDQWMQILIDRGRNFPRMAIELETCKAELHKVRARNEELEIAIGKLKTRRDNEMAHQVGVQQGDLPALMLSPGENHAQDNKSDITYTVVTEAELVKLAYQSKFAHTIINKVESVIVPCGEIHESFTT